MNAILAGVGGQGTVLAARLIAYAAMQRGLPVRNAETIGMAQRGGSVTSHVRIGADEDDAIPGPLVPRGAADVICAFEPGEATRALPYLAPQGVLVTADKAVRPVSASLSQGAYSPADHLAYLERALPGRISAVSTDEVIEQLGSSRPLNVVLLGAACASGALFLTLAEMQAAIEALVKPAFVEMNYAALDMGERFYITSSDRWQA